MKLGINENISNSEYHSDREYLSSSALKLLLSDPNKFNKIYIENNEEHIKQQTQSMILGSLVHSMILEPELTDKEFVVYEGIRRGKAWDKFKEENDKEVVTRLQYTLAEQLRDITTNSKIANDLLQNGEAEQTLCVDLEGLKIKVRADYYNSHQPCIVDLKTTFCDMSKQQLQDAIGNFQYDLSAALYVDAFATLGKEVPPFYFIFLGTGQVKDIVIYKASESMIENGRRKYKKAIEKYKEMKKSGDWNQTIIEEIGVPTWAMID